MTRSDNTFLPAEEELRRILATERRRAVAPGREGVTTADFETVIKLFQSYDLPTDIFTDDSMGIYQVISEGDKLLNTAVDKMLKTQPNDQQIELFNAAYDYLTESDTPEKSDLIFVFGGKTPFRPEKAAELYGQGMAPKVLVTGKSPIYHLDKGIQESETYQQYLIENGVPNDAIITEGESITIPDNVWRSLNLLDEQNIKHDSMILITSPYSLRRSWCLMKKFVPSETKLYRVNCKTADMYKRDRWYKTEQPLRIILNEFIKLRGSVVYGVA